MREPSKRRDLLLNLLVALFSEKESHATYFLQKQGVQRIGLAVKQGS
jgi:hypothetical protein